MNHIYYFRILDLEIPQRRTGQEQINSRDGVSSCNCVHPCDLTSSPPTQPPLSISTTMTVSTTSPARHLVERSFDFFADIEHCYHRNQRCDAEKRRQALLAEDDEVDGGGHQRKRKKRRRKHNEYDDWPAETMGRSDGGKAFGSELRVFWFAFVCLLI